MGGFGLPNYGGYSLADSTLSGLLSQLELYNGYNPTKDPFSSMYGSMGPDPVWAMSTDLVNSVYSPMSSGPQQSEGELYKTTGAETGFDASSEVDFPTTGDLLAADNTNTTGLTGSGLFNIPLLGSAVSLLYQASEEAANKAALDALWSSLMKSSSYPWSFINWEDHTGEVVKLITGTTYQSLGKYLGIAGAVMMFFDPTPFNVDPSTGAFFDDSVIPSGTCYIGAPPGTIGVPSFLGVYASPW